MESPFVTRRPELTRLYQYLCQSLPYGEEEGSGELSKKEAYQYVFHNNRSKQDKVKASGRSEKLLPKEDADLRYAISFLFTAVKKWLAYREWSKDDAASDLLLCKSLRLRGLNDLYEKEFKSLQAAASGVRQSEDFSLLQYQIALERLEFNTTKRQHDSAQLYKVFDAFGAFVANNVLRLGCAALNTPDFNLETIDYLPETMARVAAGHYREVPSIQIYYYCFRLIQAKEESDYRQLKALLFAHSSVLPVEELRDPWLIALNYGIYQSNIGEPDWAVETFELYKSSLTGGYILEDGILPGYIYQNILTLAIKHNEWDWGRQFLEDYRKLLPLKDRHNIYTFNLAVWNFGRKNYPEAQEILLKVEFRNVYYNLDARRMMVRMYYDQGAILALESLLHSFRTYLLRHRGIGYHFHIYANFVRTVRQILRLKPNDAKAREQLREKIKAEKYLADRKWLSSLV